MPEPEDNNAMRRTSREQVGEGRLPEYAEPGRKLSADDIRNLLQDSIATSAWAGVVEEPSEGILEYLTSLNLREPQRIRSDWAEVGAALKAGRFVTFDARSMLPAGLVNLSVAEM